MKAIAPALRLLAVLVLLVSACTKTIRVPPDDYGAPGSASVYRITTTTGKTLSVARYMVMDSTIVVEEFAPSQGADQKDSIAAPFTIQLRNVASIDRVVLDRSRSSGWVLAAGIVFFAVVILGTYSLATN
jgi:hypothetical protein